MNFFGIQIGGSTPQAKSVEDIVGRDPRGWSLLSGHWPNQWVDSDDIFKVLSVEDTEEAYNNPVVKACVDEIATSISECPLEIGSYDKNKEWNPLDAHPALDLLAEPNPFMSQNELLHAWCMRMELSGISYIRKLRASSGVRGLLPYPTSWVTPKYQSKGMDLVESYRIKGEASPVPFNDLVVGQYMAPDKVWGGCAPTHAAGRDIALDVERENYIAEMLLNLKVAGLVIIGKSGINARNREQVKQDIDNAIGRGRRGNPLLIEGDAEVNMQNPLKDMDWPNYSSSTESRICMSYGVPQIIVGTRFGISKATYANYAEARKSFYRETLKPKWNTYGQMLTRGLLRSERVTGLQFRFRYDLMNEFQEDLNAKSTRIVGEYNAGIIPKRTAQLELGYDPDELEEIEEEEFQKAQERTPQLLAPEDEEDEDEDEEGTDENAEETDE